MTRSSRLLLALPLAIALVTAAGHVAPAHANDGDENVISTCISYADDGQRARDDGRLLASRAALLRCGHDRCPDVIRQSCLGWLMGVEDRIPTLVVTAREDGTSRDLHDVAISLDDGPLPNERGREIRVDPGSHVLRATRKDGYVVTERIIMHERERGRAITLVFPAPPPKRIHIPRAVPWITGGLAVLGGAGFAFFWNDTMGQVDTLRTTCSPTCTDAQVDDVRPSRTMAHVSLGVGITAAISTIVLLALDPPWRGAPTKATTALPVIATPPQLTGATTSAVTGATASASGAEGEMWGPPRPAWARAD